MKHAYNSDRKHLRSDLKGAGELYDWEKRVATPTLKVCLSPSSACFPEADCGFLHLLLNSASFCSVKSSPFCVHKHTHKHTITYHSANELTSRSDPKGHAVSHCQAIITA